MFQKKKTKTTGFFFILGPNFRHIRRIVQFLRYNVFVSKFGQVDPIQKNTLYKLPDVVGAVAPNPPKLVPPNPVAADVVAVLKPPKAGADVAGAPKP